MQVNENVMPQVMKDAIHAAEKPRILERPFEYSATVLCKSPRQVQLERRHKDTIKERPVSTQWYSFYGSAIHDAIERAIKDNPRYVTERRIVRFDKPVNGKESDYRRVGAKFDAYDIETKTLYDHKTTNTYIFGKEMKDEWITQLMINAYFLEEEGYPVDYVAINAIYGDWRDTRLTYAKEGDYPLAPATEFRMKAWAQKDREYMYKALLKEHIDAETVPDEQLPYCSTEYCWESKGKVAVYRPNAQKALRLLDTIEAAEKYIADNKLTGVLIKERPSTRMRCAKYCDASSVCDQYQAWLASQPNKSSSCAEDEGAESES